MYSYFRIFMSHSTASNCLIQDFACLNLFFISFLRFPTWFVNVKLSRFTDSRYFINCLWFLELLLNILFRVYFVLLCSVFLNRFQKKLKSFPSFASAKTHCLLLVVMYDSNNHIGLPSRFQSLFKMFLNNYN